MADLTEIPDSDDDASVVEEISNDLIAGKTEFEDDDDEDDKLYEDEESEDDEQLDVTNPPVAAPRRKKSAASTSAPIKHTHVYQEPDELRR